MGFALWIGADHVWAQGTHEYRPMGAAVAGLSSTLTPRDFRRRRSAPPRTDPRFAGLFASLGEMNDYLARYRLAKTRSRRLRIFSSKTLNRALPPF
jgi:hypothetical protein